MFNAVCELPNSGKHEQNNKNYSYNQPIDIRRNIFV